MRLDQQVQQTLTISRNEAMRLIAAGLVRLNGRVCEDKGRTVLESDVIEVNVAEAERVVPQPEIKLKVLAKSKDWAVIEKPCNMPVHPLKPQERDTVLNGVVALFPQIQGVGEEGGLRSGVVHRLDVETSGCLVFALNNDTWKQLREAFSLHTMKKTYLAEVEGALDGDGEVNFDLVIRRHSPAFVCVADFNEKGARRCTMTYKVLEKRKNTTLVEVDLQTGFLHQIRASFAHLKHPVVGDVHYGAKASGRLMLHAWKLECKEMKLKAQSDWPAIKEPRA